MISRRQLIRDGMALSGVGLAGPGFGARKAFANGFFANPDVVPKFLLVDTRFDNALEIARQMLPAVETIHLQRDVLELWHDRLRPVPGSRSITFAGVTTEHGFFTLRTLATDHRLRVRSARWHAALPGTTHREPLVSWVIGPQPTLLNSSEA